MCLRRDNRLARVSRNLYLHSKRRGCGVQAAPSRWGNQRSLDLFPFLSELPRNPSTPAWRVLCVSPRLPNCCRQMKNLGALFHPAERTVMFVHAELKSDHDPQILRCDARNKIPFCFFVDEATWPPRPPQKIKKDLKVKNTEKTLELEGFWCDSNKVSL